MQALALGAPTRDRAAGTLALARRSRPAALERRCTRGERADAPAARGAGAAGARASAGRARRSAAWSRRWAWRVAALAHAAAAARCRVGQRFAARPRCGGAASSAAAVGVGARTSAAKSASVKSVSWPTPHTSGTGLRDDRAREALIVEGPEVLDRPAAAAAGSGVDLGAPARAARSRRRAPPGASAPCTAPDRRRPRTCGARRARRSARRAACRGRSEVTTPMRTRKRRQRALARRVEQPFGFEPRPQPQEAARTSAPGASCAACTRRPVAGRRAARTRPAGPHLDQFAVGRREVEQAGGAPEHRAAQRASPLLGVLQREVAVAAGGAREAGDLAAHDACAEARAQRIATRPAAARRRSIPGSTAAGAGLSIRGVPECGELRTPQLTAGQRLDPEGSEASNIL